jgi:hypothetical protein
MLSMMNAQSKKIPSASIEDNQTHRWLRGKMLAGKSRCALILFICLFLVYGAHVVYEYKPHTYAYADPGWMVSTVMSMVEDHDLDLRNQLQNDPNQAADQTSQGKDGQWYPLHEFLMPVFTVPFYLIFGIDGCLIFNVFISIALMIALFNLCARHVDYASAFAATVLTAFATLFLNYTYSYSLDVFGTLLLILAYWCAVTGRFSLAGFVWGLAIFARLPNIVTLAGFLPFLLLEGNSATHTVVNRSKAAWRFIKIRPVLLSFAGGLPAAFCIFLSNWLMFGSPLVTSYDRWQHFVNGKAIISSQSGALCCSLIDRLQAVLLDPKSGLLIGGPIIILVVAFGIRLFWQKARNEMILSFLVSIALLVLVSKYCHANPGAPGNRYLMPVVALCTIPLSLVLDDCFNAARKHL